MVHILLLLLRLYHKQPYKMATPPIKINAHNSPNKLLCSACTWQQHTTLLSSATIILYSNIPLLGFTQLKSQPSHYSSLWSRFNHFLPLFFTCNNNNIIIIMTALQYFFDYVCLLYLFCATNPTLITITLHTRLMGWMYARCVHTQQNNSPVNHSTCLTA